MIGGLLPLAIAIAWEVGSRTGRLPNDTFSRPSAIATALVRGIADGSIVAATAQTMQAASVAWVLALLLGIAFGVTIGISPILRRLFETAIELLRPIPSVALIPIALVLFGFGATMEMWIVGFAVFWPVVVLTASGVRAIDQRLLEVGRALGLGPLDRFRQLVLPAALPSIAVGARIGTGFALVVAVTVEIAVDPRGLGYAMIMAQQQFRADVMYAELVSLGAVGMVINALMIALERRALAWSFIEGRR